MKSVQQLMSVPTVAMETRVQGPQITPKRVRKCTGQGGWSFNELSSGWSFRGYEPLMYE